MAHKPLWFGDNGLMARMARTKALRCVVCGKPFGEGTMIGFLRGDLLQTLHHPKCQRKMLRQHMAAAIDAGKARLSEGA